MLLLLSRDFDIVHVDVGTEAVVILDTDVTISPNRYEGQVLGAWTTHCSGDLAMPA